jgi:hypothetical protein
MPDFKQFLADAANRGEAVNTLFEERLFDLVGILHKIADTLTSELIPYEVIGGLAVLIHVEEVNPEFTALTRDVDLMVRRSDLERIKIAVRLIFSGERVRPDYRAPTPPIEPESKNIHGKEIMVIPVADLVRMKLTANRDKDRAHIRSLDACGLISHDIENGLTPELLSRLEHVRATE